MSKQKIIIKCTDLENRTILIGVESIIGIETIKKDNVLVSKILSRGAMVETFRVKESIDEIWQMINE
jgi:hypothetical protein